MKGRALISRIMIVLAIAISLLALAGEAEASPIRPNIEKVLTREPAPVGAATPARAGWNGPETARVAVNPTLEAIGPAAQARRSRVALFAVAMPDWRIFAMVLLVILLVRRIRRDDAPAEVISIRGHVEEESRRAA